MLDLLALTVGIHIGSYHWDNKPEYNNNNVGIYVRTKDGWHLGTYLNTFRKQTVYLGHGWELSQHVNVMVGGATGYKYPVTPFYMFSYELTKHSKVFVNHEVINLALEF